MRSHRRRAVLASGVALELAQSGQAGSRTVLALHGEDGPASMVATIDHLAITHQVIAPTHPGWAGTDRAASLNGVGALARAYLDILADEGRREVVVVGASFGAWVAAQMAIDDTEGRIGAVVLLGPIGLHAPGPVASAPAVAAARGAGRRGATVTAAAVAGALGAYVGPAAFDPTLAARLASVGVPTLVVRGGEDHALTPACAREWADALGDGRLVVVTGGGHLPFHRAPWTTFAAIDAFLSPPLVLTA